MERDDIIRMAREAGFESNSLGVTYTSGSLPDLLERFAALIAEEASKAAAAAEREACAKVCAAKAHEWREEDMHTWPDGRRTSMGDSWYQHRAEGAIECAEIIRARGQE